MHRSMVWVTPAARALMRSEFFQNRHAFSLLNGQPNPAGGGRILSTRHARSHSSSPAFSCGVARRSQHLNVSSSARFATFLIATYAIPAAATGLFSYKFGQNAAARPLAP